MLGSVEPQEPNPVLEPPQEPTREPPKNRT